MGTQELEWHQLDLKYESVRRRHPIRERQLVSSLLETGQQLPIVVVVSVPGTWVVIDGYKRIRCLRQLRFDTVHATVWQLDEKDALLLERLMRPSGTDGPMEQGWILLELSERFGLGLEELAARFGKTKSWVSRRIGLVKQLPQSIQEQVLLGRVCPHAAMKYLLPLARANAPVAEALAQAISPLRLSSRQVGLLYGGWMSGEAKTKQLIVQDPMLYLRAQQSTKPSSSPARLVVEDLETMSRATKRIRARLMDGVWQGLVDAERQETCKMLERTRGEVESLFDRFALEYTKSETQAGTANRSPSV